MILFHKCPECFQAFSCYPIYSCIQPLTQSLYQSQLLQQQPIVQPALSPSYYAPSPKAKG